MPRKSRIFMNGKFWALPLGLVFAAIFSFCKNDKKLPAPAAPQGNASPEILELSRLIAADPQNDSLLFLRARAFYEEQSFDPAIQDVALALQIDSLQPPYFHLLADIFMDYYKSREALRIMETAADRFPGRVPTLLKLSEFQLILKKHSEALSSIDKIFRKDPQNAEAWFMTGQICKDMGQLDRAISSYKKCISFTPDNMDAYISLGQIYAFKKDKIALEYLNNALRIDSNSMEARHAIADYYSEIGDLKKAVATYRDIINRDKSYQDAYLNLGLIYLDLDSLKQAKYHFDLALKADPLFIKAFYYRGVAEEKLGDKAAALADYDMAARNAPGFKEAQEAVDRLKSKK